MNPPAPRSFLVCSVALALTLGVWTEGRCVAQQPVAPQNPPAAPDFQTQIRPILSNRCFACHGPDEGTVESGLRLDSQTASRAPGDSGQVAVVPGDPANSELVRSIFSPEEDVRIPPPHSVERRSANEVAVPLACLASRSTYLISCGSHTLRLPPVPQV